VRHSESRPFDSHRHACVQNAPPPKAMASPPQTIHEPTSAHAPRKHSATSHTNKTYPTYIIPLDTVLDPRVNREHTQIMPQLPRSTTRLFLTSTHGDKGRQCLLTPTIHVFLSLPQTITPATPTGTFRSRKRNGRAYSMFSQARISSTTPPHVCRRHLAMYSSTIFHHSICTKISRGEHMTYGAYRNPILRISRETPTRSSPRSLRNFPYKA